MRTIVLGKIRNASALDTRFRIFESLAHNIGKMRNRAVDFWIKPDTSHFGLAEFHRTTEIAAVGEALLFASKAGADPAQVRQALMGGFASSRILEVHGERMIKRNFTPGFRVELHQKDLSLALAGAKELGISLPATSTCQQLFNAVVASGGAALDHSALVQALETLAAHPIAK